jgi:hypothetical protein
MGTNQITESSSTDIINGMSDKIDIPPSKP